MPFAARRADMHSPRFVLRGAGAVIHRMRRKASEAFPAHEHLDRLGVVVVEEHAVQFDLFHCLISLMRSCPLFSDLCVSSALLPRPADECQAAARRFSFRRK